MTLDYKSVLEKIRGSEWAKEIKEEFGGDKDFTEEGLIEQFFYEKFEVIVKVLPELWEDIKEEVKGEFCWVVDNPKDFEDAVVSHLGKEYLSINFSLEKYLAHVCEMVVRELKSEVSEVRKSEQT